MWVTRRLMTRLVEAAAHFPVVLLTGGRQTGKTSLARRAFAGHGYVSLDLPSDAALAESSPEEFFGRHGPPLLIDEVQYAPALFRHLKVRVDQRRHRGGQFVLTGSQQFPLMREVSESLAGRVAIFELEGLSAYELRASAVMDPHRDLLELLLRGQFPELWRDPELAHAMFHRAFLTTYIERDVRQIMNVTSLRDFERFLRLCAARNGQLVNKTDLGRDVGITAKTVDQWLGVLQASNQIALLEPWFGNVGKRLIKSPKLYFRDTGLLCFLLGLDHPSLAQSPLLGGVWEAFVYAELRKALAAHAPEWSVWFYRDQQGREVDFVLQGGGRLVCIECKWSELPDHRSGRSLREIANTLEQAVPRPLEVARVMAARPTSSYPLADGTQVIHGADIADWLCTAAARA